MRSLLLITLALSLGACAADRPEPREIPAATALNSRCPIMPDLDADGVTFVEWRGSRVGFCCAECVEKWDRMSDADRDRVLAKVR